MKKFINAGLMSVFFIVNSLIIWASYDAMKIKSYGLASVTGFFGLGWYVGNIRGSIQAAREYNEAARNEFVDEMIEGVNLD